MANYCSNVAKLISEKKETLLILKRATETGGDIMQFFNPTPSSIILFSKHFFAQSEQYVIQKQYGCKTVEEFVKKVRGDDAYMFETYLKEDIKLEDGYYTMKISFITKWEPALALYNKICENFGIDMHVYFSEPGMEVFGEYNFEDGESNVSYYNLPEEIPEEMIVELGLELDLDCQDEIM